MSHMVRRPPATRYHLLSTGGSAQQGPLTASAPAPNMAFAPVGDFPTPRRDLGRQTHGAVDQTKKFGGAQAGSTDDRTNIQYTWQDRVQVPPAHEQPRIPFNSGGQPLVRWGLMRRFSRTFMAASPRFQGRWFYVGYIQRFYADRARLTGVATRQGKTYVQRRMSTGPGPRAIILGESG